MRFLDTFEQLFYWERGRPARKRASGAQLFQEAQPQFSTLLGG